MKIYQDELGWRIGTGGDERVAQVFKTRKDAQKYLEKIRSRREWFKRFMDPTSIYCNICKDWISKNELQRWTGDDALHYLCPGCGKDMLPVRNPDKEYDDWRQEHGEL